MGGVTLRKLFPAMAAAAAALGVAKDDDVDELWVACALGTPVTLVP